MTDVESVKRAFIAGQDATFREQVALWASDETVSNADFSTWVSNLQWNMAMDRIAWFNQFNLKFGVDTSQRTD